MNSGTLSGFGRARLSRSADTAKLLRGDGGWDTPHGSVLKGTAWPANTTGADGDWFILSFNSGASYMIGPKSAGAWPATQSAYALGTTGLPFLDSTGNPSSTPAGPSNTYQVGAVLIPSLYISSGNDAALPSWDTISNVTRTATGYQKDAAAAVGYALHRTSAQKGGADAEIAFAVVQGTIGVLPSTAATYLGVGITDGAVGYFAGTKSTGELTIFRLTYGTAPTVVAASAAGGVVAGDVVALIRNAKYLTAISSAGTTIRTTVNALVAYNVDSIYGYSPGMWFQDGDTAGRIKAFKSVI